MPTCSRKASVGEDIGAVRRFPGGPYEEEIGRRTAAGGTEDFVIDLNEAFSAIEDVLMNELPRIIPDVQVLLALTPEELAEQILFLLKKTGA